MKPIHVGIMGVGTVGGGTATVLKRNAEEISRRAGRTIALKMAANLDVAKARELVGDDVEVVSDARLVATHPHRAARCGAGAWLFVQPGSVAAVAA